MANFSAEIWDTLRGMGFTKEATAGVLGNIREEVGEDYNPDTLQGGVGPGYGLTQWDGSKYPLDHIQTTDGIAYVKRLMGLAGITEDYRSVLAQCKLIKWSMLNGQWTNPPNGYTETPDEFITETHDSGQPVSPEYMARVFEANYERPAGWPHKIRETYAREIYNAYKDREPGTPPPGGTPTPPPPAPSKPDDKPILINEVLEKVTGELLGHMVNGLKPVVYEYGNTETLANGALTVTKEYNNTYKVKFSNKFMKDTEKKIKELIGKNMVVNQPQPPEKPTEPDHTHPNPPANTSENGLGDAIVTFCKENLGNSFNPHNQPYGAQCVCLIQQIALSFNQPLPVVGTGNARDIFITQQPAPGWKRVEGDPLNDDNAKKIWETLPMGTIVFYNTKDANFVDSPFGHVAIKGGGWAQTYAQNVGKGAGAYGTPLRFVDETNLFQWGYCGLLGAWTPPPGHYNP